MRFTSRAILMTAGLVLGAFNANAATGADGCAPIGKAHFTCVSGNAEDLVAIPGSDWIVISGVLRAVNTKDNSEVSLFTAENRLDGKLYGSCPGPLTGAEIADKKIHAHGINVREGKGGLHTLYVVHHGSRESVEVFELDARGKAPKTAWVGCVPAPADAGFNGLAVLPDNGVAVTSFTRRSMGGFRGEKGKMTRERLAKGENVSEIWEWMPGKEWTIIPGSEGPGLNGVEASKDGKYLYASAWATGEIIRYTRGQTPSEKKILGKVNFHADNIRWQPDGSLVTAGQTGSVDEVLEECLANQRCTKTASSVAIIDPASGKVREVVTGYPSNGEFDLSTAALIAGKEMWVGSIGRGARIARFPLQ
ncbi:MAG: hypothetical protein AB7H70_11050 [Rhodospirillaceae bacterium]